MGLEGRETAVGEQAVSAVPHSPSLWLSGSLLPSVVSVSRAAAPRRVCPCILSFPTHLAPFLLERGS